MNNGDMPASPVLILHDDGDIQAGSGTGLTKREYFAGLAMQGMIGSEVWALDELAECAINAADALLAQLEKTNDH